jgi:hypothetical protein
MIPNFCAGFVVCNDTSATFDISYQETRCGFLSRNATATSFTALHIDLMYPNPSSAALAFEPPNNPCVTSTNNTSQGFLQGHLL